jgi:hypothetical protein
LGFHFFVFEDPAFLTFVDPDRKILLIPAELGSFHVRKFDVVGKGIDSRKFTSFKEEESARCLDVLYIQEGFAPERLDHLIDGLTGAILRFGPHNGKAEEQTKT